MKKFLRLLFNIFQKVKINLLPNHYYSNIPDFKSLNRQRTWREPRSMAGINGTDLSEQFNFVKGVVEGLEDKSVLTGTNVLNEAARAEGELGYGPIEADFLHCFVAHYKPKKIIQIGCGVSTAIALRAAKAANYTPEIVCVEPYPSPYLNKMSEAGNITLISEIAQDVNVETLLDLEEGDLFFVDSTHTVKVGSEVNKIILEVLPQLKKGVFVHFHDIYFPFDYQRNIESTVLFWSESTLLHAFLANNSRYCIRASHSMLHYGNKEGLKSIFPNYKPQSEKDGIPDGGDQAGEHFPSAIYLEVIAD